MRTTAQRIEDMKRTALELRREVEALESVTIRARALLSELDVEMALAHGSAEADERELALTRAA